MGQLGAKQAYNLDGGNSATLAFNGEVYNDKPQAERARDRYYLLCQRHSGGMRAMDSTFTILGLTAPCLWAVCQRRGACAAGRHGHPCTQAAHAAGLTGLFGLLGIPLGIVCARALYCVFHLSDFWETYENPWLMLRFFDGGLAMPGLLRGSRWRL